jgi:hypothetical protein
VGTDDTKRQGEGNRKYETVKRKSRVKRRRWRKMQMCERSTLEDYHLAD